MIKQFRIAFGLKPGSSILTFRARHVPNAPEGCLEARWRDWPLTILLTNFSRICQKMPKYFFEIDVGGVRMDSYGSVWTRMGPYGPWGLPGGFLGPPGALGGPERGVKGGSPPGGARGALLGGLPISLRGILTYMPLRAAYGTDHQTQHHQAKRRSPPRRPSCIGSFHRSPRHRWELARSPST